jgi:ornithine cyclodeaminase
MIGAGSLAPYLIAAHKCVRPIHEVLVWSRNHANADNLATSISAKAIKDVKEYIPSVDLISCATPSQTPLVHGEGLRAGQHLDLVGGYTPEMREADDVAVSRSRVFIDTEGALHEAGDIIQPIRHGILRKSMIQGDLMGLTSGKVNGRIDNDEITLFKSTGHAVEDIATAVWLFEGGAISKK